MGCYTAGVVNLGWRTSKAHTWRDLMIQMYAHGRGLEMGCIKNNPI